MRIQSENYLVRTLAGEDASDRWAGWMADPEAMYLLNLPARNWTKADVLNYIKTFDQRSVLLLGIFEKASGAHIGIFTVDINHVTGQFLINLLIGEPDHRRKGVTWEVTVPFRDYFFEALGLKVALASVLARNTPIIQFLQRAGWTLDQTLARRAKSNADGEMLDICLFSQSREAWRAWKKAHLPGQKT
ncbi:MAG TPA: GNAT family protein [Xanthobacteraceae bacterium]